MRVKKSEKKERNSMSKINNVGLNLGHKIANPFKTSRNITTPNPFKYSDFEGNSLPYADVFGGVEKKNVNKFKMMASSVAGSMNKLRSSIAEPIVNFVRRVGTGISNAWDYAKNTNISDVAGIKNISESLHNTISGIGNSISDRVSDIHKNVTDMGKNLSDKWNSLVSKIHHNRITKDTTVDELRTMWINEIVSSTESEAA